METPTEGPLKIIVTGEHDPLSTRFPQTLADQRRLEWISLPVLRFERLPVKADLVEQLVQKPMDWILFTSQRAVQFWSEVILEYGVDFPLETQVACIGESTAEAAGRDGFNADFYPTEPGTEGFLEEFASLLSNKSSRPSIFIPQAEGGRTTLRDRLRAMGCEVLQISLYRTLPREDLASAISKQQIDEAALILFTSPSSVDAFTRVFTVPSHVKVASLGRYTAKHLVQKGFSDQRMLPEGDFGRIEEVLCQEKS